MSVHKAKYGTPIVLAIILASCASTQPTANSLLGQHAEANAAEAGKGETAAAIDNALKQAQAQRLDGDLQGAASTLGQLVLATPDDARVLGEYGKVLAAQGRADDALAFLRRSAQLQPNDWTVYSAMGVAFDQKNNFNSAKVAYERALMLKPGEPSVLSNAALSRMLAGDLDNAEQMLLQASANGKDPKIAKNLALVRSLKASAPQVARATPARPAPVKEAVVAPMPAPASAPVAAAKPAPAPTPVAANAPASNAKAQAKTFEMLKRDPTVRMAPIPRGETHEEAASKPASVPHIAAAAPAPHAAPAVKAAQSQPAPLAAPHVLPQAPVTQVAAPAKAPAPVATAAPQPIVNAGAMQVQKTATKEAAKPAAKTPAPVKAATNAPATPAPAKPATKVAEGKVAEGKVAEGKVAEGAAKETAKPVIVIKGKPKEPSVETAMLRPTVTDVTPVAATAHKNTTPENH